MKPFVTLVNDKLYWNYRPQGKKRYRIVMWAKSIDGNRDEIEVKPNKPCTISDLMPVLDDSLVQLLDKRTDVIGYGFSAWVWG